ncbi:hypothetical protein [Peteryoungia ipomoeae]|uniref:Uncharacterized protein n=1 Tax=Peteryoungia ipomoeae TaxID=1210932 RepID=A0A4S8NVT8_9HYPH|nr:hypothetical protein [Peteryoungia ipomoeae]THV20921.1 hypothetical protein FAA97_17145 [Peteryoungia ipomoeae]
MQFAKLAAAACLSLAISVAPFALIADGAGIGTTAAFAKDKGGGSGNGGGKSGGSGGKDGGKSSGKSGNNSGGNSRGHESKNARSIDRGQRANVFSDAIATITGKKAKSSKTHLSDKRAKRPAAKPTVGHIIEPVTTLASVPREKPKTRPIQAKLAGLNSLNRNYHAYLNSSDPRMAAIRDYAVAYATYELSNGVDILPTDAAVDDEALRAALEATARPGTVIDDEMLEWAKTTLGVGPAVGKIDEIREELAAAAPVEPVVDPVLDPVIELETPPTIEPGDDMVTEPDPVGPDPEDVALARDSTDSTDTGSVTP